MKEKLNSFLNFYRNMNLPNRLTCLRMLLIIPFVLCMLPGKAEGAFKWMSLILFVAASLTDLLDGKIERGRNLVTDFGKFMDPLADKLLVVSALICLIELDRVPAWIVLIIIAREFIISGFRLIAADNGIVIAAGMSGKVKTVLQMIMVILMIINFTDGPMKVLTDIVMYAAIIMTIVSLVEYIYKNRSVISTQK